MSDERPVFTRPQPGSYRYDRFFAGGKWLQAQGDETNAVFDAATEEEIGSTRSASLEDIDVAVAAASEAFESWRLTPAPERAAHLRRLRDVLHGRSAELASVIASEVGTAARMSLIIQVDSAIDLLGVTADLLESERFEEEAGNSTVIWEPVGVVAAITPWNYPLFQTMGKVAGALAAGCTVVHKPSEMAPLSTFILAESIEAAGLPAGVYNLVPGRGRVVGEALATHPKVAMTSFTGSTAAGRRVYELGARTIKRVALELGGKSASVILDDEGLDLERAVKSTVNRAFLNSGQTCDAWTRLLVPKRLLGDVNDLAVDSAARLVVGDPFAEGTRLGPVISENQRTSVRGYIDGALAAGADLVTGGSDAPEGYERGHFVKATVLSGVTPDMRVAQEEVFGPVLVVMAYEGEDQAAAWSNATEYGLSGAVWAGDDVHAMAFARRMETGQVVLNGGRFNPLAPFGGFKQSGVGRELGAYGIREFLEPKAYQH
ncbi:MAG: aldehyde dehydrogenase family protein [Actinomycetota bacterium]